MKRFVIALSAILGLLILSAILFFTLTPEGRTTWNNWFHDVQKADDNTRYANRKHVEDTCRAMMASYESDRLTWLQYKDSETTEHRGWADQAKMRANKTAASYNEYVLKNSYVWEDNVPADIRGRLDYIGE